MGRPSHEIHELGIQSPGRHSLSSQGDRIPWVRAHVGSNGLR